MGSPPNPAERNRRRAVVVATVLVVVSFLLRMFRLGDQELWYDEAYSYHMATIRSGLPHALGIENSPPLYYLLLRGWILFAGTSEFGLRSLSAILGTCFVSLVIWTGWRLFNPSVGLWSGAIAALSPIHIYYSQEARGYTLLTCALLLTYVTLWRALEKNSAAAWATVGLTALIALYTHFFTPFGLLPTLIVTLLWQKQTQQQGRRRRYLLTAGVCGLLFLPWVLWSFVFTAHPTAARQWLVEEWAQSRPLLAIPTTLEVFGIGPDKHVFPNLTKIYPALEYPGALRYVGLLLLALLAMAAAVPAGDRRLGIPLLTLRKVWLWTTLMVPLIAMWLVSFYRPVYRVGRYDLVAFPAYVLLAGLALAKLHRVPRFGRALGPLVATALFAVLSVKLLLYYDGAVAHHLVLDGRETAKILVSSSKPGDVLAFNLPRAVTTLYYLSKFGYRWESGACINELTGVRLVCRIFPVGEEQSFGELRPPVQLSSLVRELVFDLKRPQDALWVAADPTYVTDVLFVTELSKMDLTTEYVRVPSSPLLLRFQRR